MNKSDWLSVLATVISILSFFVSALVAVWRSWRERPRLRFAVTKVTRLAQGEKQYNLVEIKVSNIGFRPIIVTAFIALGQNATYFMGDIDPTAASYGKAVDVFPTQLHPGSTIKIYPLTLEALEQNQANLTKLEYRWLFFVIVDSFNNFFQMHIQDILFELDMSKSWRPRTKWECAKSFILLRRLATKAIKDTKI